MLSSKMVAHRKLLADSFYRVTGTSLLEKDIIDEPELAEALYGLPLCSYPTVRNKIRYLIMPIKLASNCGNWDGTSLLRCPPGCQQNLSGKRIESHYWKR